MQVLRQPREDTLRVEAQFQERTEVFRWRVICFAGQTAVRPFGVGVQFQWLELRTLNLSRCQDAGMIANDAVHEPFPVPARLVKPGQAPETVQCQILPEIIPIIRAESEVRLQKAGPQRRLLEQVRSDIGQGYGHRRRHHRRTPWIGRSIRARRGMP